MPAGGPDPDVVPAGGPDVVPAGGAEVLLATDTGSTQSVAGLTQTTGFPALQASLL